ncbi:hypothetical protein GS892_25015 [Rhodococcus hoagii]|uniref:hypothetical protein n=1 Tax=Rhodococcus hoagii TaxID=43767 RepID=UPI000A2628B8|nr:hypothetical protein [Prescottella equi]NKV08573.1 hypothetical protein [Prescottella equi]NKV08598.1 hypothetical protein [Prescottella equi]NKV09574.1 hypothetical protein [Prescottella equi]ORL30442.1 hypothetical protein A6I91_21125 [Prescottella equi]
MAWFKVDDAFHASRKLKSIPARYRLAAAGLWVIAGSWCSQEKTDGHVPNYMIREWGATPKTVESLVDAGLWSREHDGYAFRSWLEYNPSRAQVESERAASKERMQASRERRRNKAAAQDSTVSDVAAQQSEELQRNAEPVLQRPDPTRPDPTRPLVSNSGRESHVGERASHEPPPTTCPKHPAGTTAPCRACGDARAVRDRWDADERRRQSEAQSAEARQRAELRRAAVEACGHCDDDGRRLDAPGLVCDHTEDQADRTRRGIAAARAALNPKGVPSDA